MTTQGGDGRTRQGGGGGGTARPARRDQPPADAETQADGRDVRALILDATEQLLSGRRFESLSVADILSAAGVSRGSFYFYFANKHAVLAELVSQAVSTAHEAAGTWAGDKSKTPGVALRRGTMEGSRLWREHAPVLRAIVENWQSDPALAALWTEMIDGFAAVATERIKADRAAGLAPASDDDPQVLASVLCWMNERAWYLAAIGHSGFTDEARLITALTEVWQAAIYGTAESPPRA
ncbi:MAG: TetR/AcrR family transcriptional regulator [Nocardiopsaceae bacterium]|nr:TetR/AcrR family transcriptional regulator [Nocardiopsaceae bacterium]